MVIIFVAVFPCFHQVQDSLPHSECCLSRAIRLYASAFDDWRIILAVYLVTLLVDSEQSHVTLESTPFLLNFKFNHAMVIREIPGGHTEVKPIAPDLQEKAKSVQESGGIKAFGEKFEKFEATEYRSQLMASTVPSITFNFKALVSDADAVHLKVFEPLHRLEDKFMKVREAYRTATTFCFTASRTHCLSFLRFSKANRAVDTNIL